MIRSYIYRFWVRRSRAVRILLIVSLVLITGQLLPRIAITNNIASFPMDQQADAYQALRAAQRLHSGSLEPLLITGYRVKYLAPITSEHTANGCPFSYALIEVRGTFGFVRGWDKADCRGSAVRVK